MNKYTSNIIPIVMNLNRSGVMEKEKKKKKTVNLVFKDVFKSTTEKELYDNVKKIFIKYINQ